MTITTSNNGNGQPTYDEIVQHHIRHTIKRARTRHHLDIPIEEYWLIVKAIQSYSSGGRQRSQIKVFLVGDVPNRPPRKNKCTCWYACVMGVNVPVIYEDHPKGGFLLTVYRHRYVTRIFEENALRNNRRKTQTRRSKQYWRTGGCSDAVALNGAQSGGSKRRQKTA